MLLTSHVENALTQEFGQNGLRQLYQQLNFPECFFHTIAIDDFYMLLEVISDCFNDQDDFNTCTLDKSGIFIVKFFYKFLIDAWHA